MVPPLTPSLWLQQQALPLMLLLLSASAVYLILRGSARSRARRLARERAWVTEQTFTRHLELYGFDPVIAGSTYRYLQEVQRVQFPVLPGDRLDEDLGLDTSDIDQTIRELSRSLGRHSMPGLLHRPLASVEDLVRLLQASPRVVARAA
jgi:hypothetical protein